jgi:hypothetical protein
MMEVELKRRLLMEDYNNLKIKLQSMLYPDLSTEVHHHHPTISQKLWSRKTIAPVRLASPANLL